MRTIKELLQIALNVKTETPGLCSHFIALNRNKIITFRESRLLQAYLYKNNPITLFRIFNPSSAFFWKPFNIWPRKRWLKKHIKKH